MGVVILTGDLKDIRTVISADLGLWENEFLVPERNFYISDIEHELILQSFRDRWFARGSSDLFSLVLSLSNFWGKRPHSESFAATD